MTERNERSAVSRVLRAGGVVLLVGLVYVGITFVQVWSATHRDEARPAEAIVVLGAAQYDGTPSPVLRARLDHVVELYDEGIAPLVVVTGGAREGDRFTEAAASAAYLSDHGVPGGVVERETTGATSYESLASVARFLRERGISEVVLVSDPFHAYRIGEISREVGMRAAVSPTPSSTIGGTTMLRHLLKETAGVSAGRIIGYRRLHNIAKGI